MQITPMQKCFFSAVDPDDKMAIGSCTIRVNDLNTLCSNGWLNDNVIHSYLGLVSQESQSTVLCLTAFLAAHFKL